MAFSLGLENLNEEVFSMGTSEELDYAEVIAAEYELDSAIADLDGVLASKEAYESAIGNLNDIQTAIEAHGVSAGLLALINEDGQMEKALDFSAPELTSENAEEVAQVYVESIKDSVKKGYEKVKAFFKKIWKYIVDAIKTAFDSTGRYYKALGKMKKKLDGIKEFDVEAFEKAEVKAYSHEVFMTKANKLDKLVSVTATLKTNDEGKVYQGALPEALKPFNYTVKENKIEKEGSAEDKPSKKSMKDLKWDVAKVKGGHQAAKDALDAIQNLKNIQKESDRTIKDGLKAIANLERVGEKEAAEKSKKELTATQNLVTVQSKVISIVIKEGRTLASQYLAIAGKLKKKGEKKDDE